MIWSMIIVVWCDAASQQETPSKSETGLRPR